LKVHDGKGLRVAIVHTRWNESIVAALVNGAKTALRDCGVKADDIHIVTVPGSYELPFAARSLAVNGDDKGRRFDSIIAIGVLIKGDTMHFEYICDAATHGLLRVGLDTGRPVIFGVLTCLTELQAQKRAGLTADGHNHGTDWGLAAVEMAKYRFLPSKL